MDRGYTQPDCNMHIPIIIITVIINTKYAINVQKFKSHAKLIENVYNKRYWKLQRIGK